MKGNVVRLYWKIERVSLTPVDKFAALGPRVFNIIAASLMLLTVIVAGYFGLTTPAPSKEHPYTMAFIRNWQQVAGITGALLWIIMVALTLLAYGDVRRAQDADQKRVAWHSFRMAIYRLVAKTLIAALLVEIWLQRYRDIIAWIRAHPLAQFELIFAAAIVLTLLGMVELLWYRWWIQQPVDPSPRPALDRPEVTP